MSATMGSGPLILFVCASIAMTIAHPYGHQEILTTQTSDHLGYRNIELQPVTYHKRFHFFAAPEEEDENVDELIPEELLKKTINVVVIKAPENNKANVAIARLAKALAEEKTAIYVLNKEPDLKEVSTLIERLKQQKITRPEVHIIKYKTQEEADLAARNIQIEYDSLRGPSEVEHQVTATLHSYVGLLDGAGIHEMMLLIYGKPLSTLEHTSPDEVLKGDDPAEALPSSSFYLPPGGEAANPSEVTVVEESNTSDVSSESPLGLYLPPETVSEATVSLSTETVAEEFVESDLAKATSESIPEELETSTTTLPAFTKSAERGSYKYFHADTTTERATTTDSLPDEYSSLTNNYLPPKEPKVRNKRLK